MRSMRLGLRKRIKSCGCSCKEKKWIPKFRGSSKKKDEPKSWRESGPAERKESGEIMLPGLNNRVICHFSPFKYDDTIIMSKFFRSRLLLVSSTHSHGWTDTRDEEARYARGKKRDEKCLENASNKKFSHIQASTQKAAKKNVYRKEDNLRKTLWIVRVS